MSAHDFVSRIMSLNGQKYKFLSAEDTLGQEYQKYPYVLRLLAENVARTVLGDDRGKMLNDLREWVEQATSGGEVHFTPGRLLMHDTTSTPALVDMAAMRDTVAAAGGDPNQLSPQLPVEVSVDHSLAVEEYGIREAPKLNIKHEIRRNRERYRFLKWAASAMDTLHINPPGTGIMHTINLEQLATVVTTELRNGSQWLVPDHMLGTDSHTPMINGLGVLAWGIGGVEAETVMFGMPTTLKIPDVVGVYLTGELGAGALATDFALEVTQRLRELGVTGEMVEFYGPGVSSLTVGDRSVVANMAPEYGATTGYFPIDDQSLAYLAQTGRTQDQINMVRAYARASGVWFDPAAQPVYSRTITIDLSAIQTSAAGPRRPQDRVAISDIPNALYGEDTPEIRDVTLPRYPVALASITSCTNTTDPRLLIAAGLLARRAREYGITPPEWVKTSLAPGSPAAASYLQRSGLNEDLSAVGFDIVGFGCATCIGNSGPLTEMIETARVAGTIQPVAALSGNRNFPGRVHPDLELGFLMSPPVVVAYALAGRADLDLATQPIRTMTGGHEVYLHDLWPSAEEIDAVLSDAVRATDFSRDFRAASNNRLWEGIETPSGPLFPWDSESTMLRPPPFAAPDQGSLLGQYQAYPLLVVGDDITTDHISPASAIPRDSFIADYLVEQGEDREDLNVFASRRGNWEVMTRGAFYAKSILNRLAPEAPTAHTIYGPTGDLLSIWDASQRYREANLATVVIAGDRYGMGSSRDWAAKVQRLLGVSAVIASSYERIHRSNLIGMGILPLVLPARWRERVMALDSADTVAIEATGDAMHVNAQIPVRIEHADGRVTKFSARAAVDTEFEVELLRAGGVIPTILAQTKITA